MTLIKTITQGGQVHIHQLRMLKQILIAGSLAALIGGGGCFIWQSLKLPGYLWRMTYETYWAQFMLETTPTETHKTVSQEYTPVQGKPYKRSSLSVIRDPLLQQTTRQLEVTLKHISIQSFKFAGLIFLAIMGIWFAMGRSQKKPEHKRGTTFAPWQTLARMLKQNNQDSDLSIDGLPLVKDKETSHILLTGTTGSGKKTRFTPYCRKSAHVEIGRLSLTLQALMCPAIIRRIVTFSLIL